MIPKNKTKLQSEESHQDNTKLIQERPNILRNYQTSHFET